LNAATDRFFPDPLAADLHNFYPRQEREKQLLDFGCGSDIFLNQARDLGWDTIGIDFSPIAVEQVRRSGHKAILASPAMWQEIEDESLDLVRMNHVLEHLYDGREVLAAIRSKMKAGARLHIAVPNPNGVTSRLFRSWAALVSEPRHVILYPPRVLASLLAQVGFSQVRVCHETVAKDFLRSLGLLWHERGWIRHEEIDQMKQRKGLAELLFTPARLAACVGVADRIHAFVRK
jgi:SAM-dependent methyltransferase